MVKVFIKGSDWGSVGVVEVEADDCKELDSQSVAIIQLKSLEGRLTKTKENEILESKLNKVILKFSVPIIKIER